MQTTAPVFNIQSYSIHDGPGIRTTVFLKGCPLRCQWCANPESHSSLPQLMFYKSKCIGCGKCVDFCPTKAIAMRNGIAATDRSLCNGCGHCVDICPTEAREIVGTSMTVDEVMKRVLEDKLFIESSGGGITVSGGEPLSHPAFIESLLQAAKDEGFHTAIESSCFANRNVVESVFRHVDLGLLDLKHMDTKEHERLTGVPNEIILDNLRYIYHGLKVPFMISLPIIPNCNDSDENINATANFVANELGADVPLRLLPYHRLGEGKKDSLGKEMHFAFSVPTDENIEHIKAIIESYGLQVQIGG